MLYLISLWEWLFKTYSWRHNILSSYPTIVSIINDQCLRYTAQLVFMKAAVVINAGYSLHRQRHCTIHIILQNKASEMVSTKRERFLQKS